MTNEQETASQQSEDEGFLSRWSRLKQQTIEEPVVAEANEVEAREAEPAEPVEEVYQPTDEDMPPLESLDEHSEYSGFMSPRVSEELRRLALRKLFHTAGFNIRDGLDDYDEDFTSFEPLGDIITSDMKFQAEMEAEKKARQLLESEASETEPLPEEEAVEAAMEDDQVAEPALAELEPGVETQETAAITGLPMFVEEAMLVDEPESGDEEENTQAIHEQQRDV